MNFSFFIYTEDIEAFLSGEFVKAARRSSDNATYKIETIPYIQLKFADGGKHVALVTKIKSKPVRKSK